VADADTSHARLNTVQEWQSRRWPFVWLDLGLCYGSTVLVEFGFGWHTTMYRLAVYGGGAFELCLPSLGNLYQNRLLRYAILGRTLRTSGTRGEGGQI
jgi:hypothetical protein